MYPEEGGAEAAPMRGGGVRSSITRNLEGLIPLILIIIIAAFLLHKFDIIQIPFLGTKEPIQMLVIGQPSFDMQVELDNQKDLVYYQEKDPAAFEVNPKDRIAQYDVVLLDQHMGATPYEKSVSRTLGEALENYVRTGGKLIVVMDSGIYRSGGVYGTGVASDVIGWQATFGDIIPVECDLGKNNVPTCAQPIVATGKVYREDLDSKIMEGIEVAPAHPAYGNLTLVTFPVKVNGTEVAFIKSVAPVTPSYFPGIIEKKLLVGKVIYFNYDPAMTPGIWDNTLEYLR